VGDSFTRPARLAASRLDPQAQRLLDAELDGLEAKLAAERGPVRLVLHESGTDCDPWAAAFLALERAGSKGRGTRSPAGDSANAELFREVIRHGHRSGTVRLASLTAGETIVAMTSWFIAGGHGYGFRMACDDACSHAQPGRLLMRRVVRALDDAAPVLFDTCADRAMPSDPLWPDRRALGCFIVGVGGARRRRMFDGLMQFKASREHGN
jgi:CelD/BcsL family acetyltransferase involved in cellulose biosynthesis